MSVKTFFSVFKPTKPILAASTAASYYTARMY